MMTAWSFHVGYDLSLVMVLSCHEVLAAEWVKSHTADSPGGIVVAYEWNIVTGKETGRKILSPKAED